MPTVAVYAAHRHPRLRYVLRELGRDTGYVFRLHTDVTKWLKSAAEARIAYGQPSADHTALVLPAHSFLSGSHPDEADLAVNWRDDCPCFFPAGEGYDTLACIFFMLSRYEEYQPFTPDRHERFPASESHALRNNYLHLPVVRMYVRRLVEALRSKYLELPPAKQWAFQLRPTYDIDLLWAYRYRGWRGIASGVRDLVTGKWSRATARFTGKAADDPYATLRYLLALHPKVKPHIFWLLANNERREDVNPHPVPAEQTKFMQSLTQDAIHGIHPGYNSIQVEKKLEEERRFFEKVFGRRPVHSRQHFLRLRLPLTYRTLRLHGITDDHSMGYGDATGWRAGTNLPFGWYDLEREEMTGLIIHPFAVMDVTLKNYLKLSPAAAQTHLSELIATTKPYGGDFALLWHNSSFAEDFGWRGWRAVYEALWREAAATG